MFVPYTIANPLTTVRVTRRLRRPGEVLVRPGETVESTHTVAQALDLPDFAIVDVAQALDLPAKKAVDYLEVKRGDTVAEGSVLAARGGLVRRTCRSPMDGRIVGSGRGRLLLEAEPRVTRLSALVPGRVVEVWPGLGVMIETVGAHVEGLWGNDREAYGVLQVLVREPHHPIRVKHINVSSQGAILIGGSTIDQETVDQAVEMQVHGIIVGSVPTSLVPRLKEVDFPVIATEGVGTSPMSAAIFQLLKSLDGRKAAISAYLGGRWDTERPYIVIPMPAQTAQPINIEAPLNIGDRVRILRGSYQGRSGKIIEQSAHMIELETGARRAGAVVDIGDKAPVSVPYVNLERLL